MKFSVNAIRSTGRRLNLLLRASGFSIQRVKYRCPQTIDLLDLAVGSLADRMPDPRVVQVGANDGEAHDGLRRHLIARGWPAVLVEPLPDACDRLERLHAGRDQIQISRCAIDCEEGTRTLYRVDPDAPLRSDSQLLASFDRNNLLRAADRVPGIAEWIISVDVPVRRLSSVIRERGWDGCDLLVVDAEGHDAEIVTDALDSGVHPTVVVFEHVNLTDPQRARVDAALTSRGYGLQAWGGETLAVRSARGEAAS